LLINEFFISLSAFIIALLRNSCIKFRTFQLIRIGFIAGRMLGFGYTNIFEINSRKE